MVVVCDQIHGLRRYHTLVTLVSCIAMFGLGLLLCTDVGTDDRLIEFHSSLRFRPLGRHLLDHIFGSIHGFFSGIHYRLSRMYLHRLCLRFVRWQSHFARLFSLRVRQGGNNFRTDIKTMLGKKNWAVRLYRIFQFCWMTITPLLIIVSATERHRSIDCRRSRSIVGFDRFYVDQLSDIENGRLRFSTLVE